MSGLRSGVAWAARLLRALLLGAAGLVAGFLLLALLLAALSERHDLCDCADGVRRGGWSWGLRSPDSGCARVCERAGGGRVVPPSPEALRQVLKRGGRPSGR